MLKVLFIIVDVLLFCLGIAISATGIWVLTDERIGHYEIEKTFTPTDFIYKSSYIIIVFGFMLTILGIIGCCGVFAKSIALLCCLASILTVPIVMFLVAVIFAWYASENVYVRMALNDELYKAWNEHEIFRQLEINLKCCGITGPKDYEKRPLPSSCLRLNMSSIDGITSKNLVRHKNTSLYTQGCQDRFQEVMGSMASVICGLSYTIGILLIIALVLAVLVRNNMK